MQWREFDQVLFDADGAVPTPYWASSPDIAELFGVVPMAIAPGKASV